MQKQIWLYDLVHVLGVICPVELPLGSRHENQQSILSHACNCWNITPHYILISPRWLCSRAVRDITVSTFRLINIASWTHHVNPILMAKVKHAVATLSEQQFPTIEVQGWSFCFHCQNLLSSTCRNVKEELPLAYVIDSRLPLEITFKIRFLNSLCRCR
jgi:hypothetical protein